MTRRAKHGALHSSYELSMIVSRAPRAGFAIWRLMSTSSVTFDGRQPPLPSPQLPLRASPAVRTPARGSQR